MGPRHNTDIDKVTYPCCPKWRANEAKYTASFSKSILPQHLWYHGRPLMMSADVVSIKNTPTQVLALKPFSIHHFFSCSITRSEQNGHQFAGDIFEWILENFDHKQFVAIGPIDNYFA